MGLCLEVSGLTDNCARPFKYEGCSSGRYPRRALGYRPSQVDQHVFFFCPASNSGPLRYQWGLWYPRHARGYIVA
jgi:hypothetical protein